MTLFWSFTAHDYNILLLYINKLHEDLIFFAIKDWFAMKLGKLKQIFHI